MGPEKRLQNYVILELRKRLFWYVKITASPEMPVGLPDIIAIVPKPSPAAGTFVGLEIKRPDGKGIVSIAQQTQINLITRAGGIARVIDSKRALSEFFEEVGLDG